MLTNEQAKENLKKYGPNELEEGDKYGWCRNKS